MKTLIVVRHGWAGDAAHFALEGGLNDDRRPIDKRGRREVRQMAKGLRFVFKECSVVATSPLVRAHQTAEVLIENWPRGEKPQLIELKELRPATAPEVTWAALSKLKAADVVTIVGHEPHLSKFLSFMLTGDTQHPLPLKKGGVAVIEIKSADKRVLKCLIQPAQLIKIRKS